MREEEIAPRERLEKRNLKREFMSTRNRETRGRKCGTDTGGAIGPERRGNKEP